MVTVRALVDFNSTAGNAVEGDEMVVDHATADQWIALGFAEAVDDDGTTNDPPAPPAGLR